MRRVGRAILAGGGGVITSGGGGGSGDPGAGEGEAGGRTAVEAGGSRAAHGREMVREQIEARGVRDPRVLAAMRKVPRHRFVPEEVRGEAYEDHPLPIGHQQTISQPYIVGLMSELAAVGPGKRVLEVGTGSGY